MESLSPVDAYLNSHVVHAFLNSDWFTMALIQEIHENEPYPDRPDLGEFSDPRLSSFFITQTKLGKGNEAYLGANLYVTREMVGPQGHPYQMSNIPFFDEEIARAADQMGVHRDREFDRRMIGAVPHALLSLIAPDDLRRKVLRVTQSYGRSDVMIDVLFWSQLVRNGAKQYALERWNSEAK